MALGKEEEEIEKFSFFFENSKVTFETKKCTFWPILQHCAIVGDKKKQLTLGKEEEEIGRSLACTVPINGGIYLNEASKSPESLIKTTE